MSGSATAESNDNVRTLNNEELNQIRPVGVATIRRSILFLTFTFHQQQATKLLVSPSYSTLRRFRKDWEIWWYDSFLILHLSEKAFARSLNKRESENIWPYMRQAYLSLCYLLYSFRDYWWKYMFPLVPNSASLPLSISFSAICSSSSSPISFYNDFMWFLPPACP